MRGFKALPKNRNSLNGIIKLVGHFIGIISKNRQKDFENEILEAFTIANVSKRVKNIIETKSKFEAL